MIYKIKLKLNKIKIWLEKSHLSALKIHCSADTDVHLNKNKTNYNSSLGMEIGVASDNRRQIACYINTSLFSCL
jgi:hypothetical protein